MRRRRLVARQGRRRRAASRQQACRGRRYRPVAGRSGRGGRRGQAAPCKPHSSAGSASQTSVCIWLTRHAVACCIRVPWGAKGRRHFRRPSGAVGREGGGSVVLGAAHLCAQPSLPLGCDPLAAPARDRPRLHNPGGAARCAGQPPRRHWLVLLRSLPLAAPAKASVVQLVPQRCNETGFGGRCGGEGGKQKLGQDGPEGRRRRAHRAPPRQLPKPARRGRTSCPSWVCEGTACPPRPSGTATSTTAPSRRRRRFVRAAAAGRWRRGRGRPATPGGPPPERPAEAPGVPPEVLAPWRRKGPISLASGGGQCCGGGWAPAGGPAPGQRWWHHATANQRSRARCSCCRGVQRPRHAGATRAVSGDGWLGGPRSGAARVTTG